MKNNIPLICKIKDKLARYGLIVRSPSASLFCKCGFNYRPYNKCKKCQMKSMLFTFMTPPTIKNKNKK